MLRLTSPIPTRLGETERDFADGLWRFAAPPTVIHYRNTGRYLNGKAALTRLARPIVRQRLRIIAEDFRTQAFLEDLNGQDGVFAGYATPEAFGEYAISKAWPSTASRPVPLEIQLLPIFHNETIFWGDRGNPPQPLTFSHQAFPSNFIIRRRRNGAGANAYSFLVYDVELEHQTADSGLEARVFAFEVPSDFNDLRRSDEPPQPPVDHATAPASPVGPQPPADYPTGAPQAYGNIVGLGATAWNRPTRATENQLLGITSTTAPLAFETPGLYTPPAGLFFPTYEPLAVRTDPTRNIIPLSTGHHGAGMPFVIPSTGDTLIRFAAGFQVHDFEHLRLRIDCINAFFVQAAGPAVRLQEILGTLTQFPSRTSYFAWVDALATLPAGDTPHYNVLAGDHGSRSIYTLSRKMDNPQPFPSFTLPTNSNTFAPVAPLPFVLNRFSPNPTFDTSEGYFAVIITLSFNSLPATPVLAYLTKIAFVPAFETQRIPAPIDYHTVAWPAQNLMQNTTPAWTVGDNSRDVPAFVAGAGYVRPRGLANRSIIPPLDRLPASHTQMLVGPQDIPASTLQTLIGTGFSSGQKRFYGFAQLPAGRTPNFIAAFFGWTSLSLVRAQASAGNPIKLSANVYARVLEAGSLHLEILELNSIFNGANVLPNYDGNSRQNLVSLGYQAFPLLPERSFDGSNLEAIDGGPRIDSTHDENGQLLTLAQPALTSTAFALRAPVAANETVLIVLEINVEGNLPAAFIEYYGFKVFDTAPDRLLGPQPPTDFDTTPEGE